jgi:putative peptidoglycan lipid II flippase
MTHAAATGGVARAAGSVSLATVVSRVAGLLREAVFAALLGASAVSDAFVFAFRIPNLLRDFFAEGALSSAFVPAFADARAREGEARALTLARRVMGTLAVVSGAVAVLGIVFAPAVVAVVAPDSPPDMRPLTTLLTRILWPFLPLVALAAVAMGVLNAHRRWFLPALAPALFNAVSVVGGVALLLVGLPPEQAVIGWAVLAVLGGAAQFLVQVPVLRSVGWRGRPTVDLAFRDPALRRIAARMGPVVIGLAGTNVMLVVTTALASRGEGWASSLSYAFRLVHLPIGLVGVAVGTVVLSAGAGRAAAGDDAGVASIAREGLRLNWFLALPAAVGLFVLARPLVSLLYERGAFDAHDAAMAADALRWYAPGIVFYAGVKAAAPLFLVRGDTRTPMLCSLAGLAANLAAALLLVEPLGLRALALAVAVGAATNYALLRALARARWGSAGAPDPGFLARVALLCALLGAAAFALDALLLRDEAVADAVVRGALLLAGIVVLGALYLVAGARLGLSEAAAVGRRFARGRPR